MGALGFPGDGESGLTQAVSGPLCVQVQPVKRIPCRFHGVVVLDTARIGRDAGKIAEEIIRHLSLLPGAEVEVTLEISAHMPEGAPDQVVRTVTENCRTLRFRDQGFEES